MVEHLPAFGEGLDHHVLEAVDRADRREELAAQADLGLGLAALETIEARGQRDVGDVERARGKLWAMRPEARVHLAGLGRGAQRQGAERPGAEQGAEQGAGLLGAGLLGAGLRGAGLLALGLLGAACADGVEVEAPARVTSTGAGGEPTATSAGGEGDEPGYALTPGLCKEGSFATGFDEERRVVCAELGSTAVAVESRCSLHLGWADSCSGCAQPSKSGHVAGALCEHGGGSDDTCQTSLLGAEEVTLYGLNFDGDVNGDDQLFAGVSCPNEGESALPGPCEPGEFAVSNFEGFVECVLVERLVARYVREHCSVFIGSRDGCDGCSEPPVKWGRAAAAGCEKGPGDDGVCATPLLSGEWVVTFGLNLDGDVDGNDKLYLGFACEAGDSAIESATSQCPAGKVVVGVDANGSLACASVAAAVAPKVRSECAAYFGWRDSCDGCSEPPQKWGKVGTETCELGAGEDSGCVTATLGATTLPLLGINPDGDVDGNDKLYVGFACVEPAAPRS